MKKIIIFKNDMLGDFLQLSGCIKEIHENFKDHKITLVCSNHNYQIAKNFPFIEKFIILNHKSFIRTLLSNLKSFIFNGNVLRTNFKQESNPIFPNPRTIFRSGNNSNSRAK